MEQAILDYTKAVELAPDSASAYNNRGRAYEKSGNLEQAIADYTKAVELVPDFAMAYNNRGYVYHETGDLEQALAVQKGEENFGLFDAVLELIRYMMEKVDTCYPLKTQTTCFCKQFSV